MMKGNSMKSITTKFNNGQRTKRKGGRFIASLLTMAMLVVVALGIVPATKTEAASTTNCLPISCYTISKGRVTTYKSVNGAYSGYIDGANDLCKITAIYSNGWCKVSYPTSKGSKSAYTQTSNFFSNVNFSTATVKAGIAKTAYRRSDCSQKLGSIYASDKIIRVGKSGNNTQLIYPVSGGYKLGWVSGDIGTTTAGGYNPQGCFDEIVSNSASQIKVRGWAFDRDNLNSQLQVHVYVGGVAGSGAPGYAITANKYRPDVNTAYPSVGAYHGFDSTINVSKTGTQTVYVYGINVGSGQNVLLGQKKVVIKSNTTPNSNNNSNGITYAKYTGVNYTNQGLSAARVACLQKAQRMATIQWTSPIEFRTWKSSKGVYNKVKATDGTSATYFKKGKTYVGIPYSMADHSFDDESWASLVKSSKFTQKYMTTSYDGRSDTTAHGIDCSYLTYLCFKAAGTRTNITYQNTSTMLRSSYYSKKNLSTIKGGDIALKSGHVMLYVGRSGSKYAFFEANASDSKVAYNTYTASQLSSYGIYKFKGFAD